jgi:hypothetical protein
MIPAFYVVRQTGRSLTQRLIVESVPFEIRADLFGDDARERARAEADRWMDFVQGQHPKDEVFVIEKLNPIES